MNRDDLLYILHELTLLKEGTLSVSIMSRANTWESRKMVGRIIMWKEFNETYGDHIRAHHARIVDGAESTTDHVWSSFEVHAVMSMDSTYRGNCEHTRFE